MTTITSLFFDLDGTLCDSSVGIYETICYAVQLFGGSCPPRNPVSRYVGPPLVQTLSALVGAEFSQQALSAYQDYYFNRSAVFKSPPYEGIEQALIDLGNVGIRLFVTTAKHEPMACLMLKHHGLLQYFEKVYGSFDDGSRGYKAEVIRAAMLENHLSPDEVLVIGDHRLDIEGAKKNGIRGVGAAWGYGGVTDLLDADAALILEKPSQIISVV